MSLRFGTDGVRGVAGRQLTPELVMALGRVAGRVLAGGRGSFLVGRDTRLSGPMLQAALSAGLAAEGVDVVDLGVLPTPGVAAVAAHRDLPAAMVSASHNPFADNGVKLFSAGGRKLSDDTERAVEEALEAETAAAGHGAPATSSRHAAPAASEGRSGDQLGRLEADHDAAGWYQQQVVEALEGRRLDGLRVVLDCGHGAAAVTAPGILEAAGATVVGVLGDAPDGTNINAGGGSTDPTVVARAVLATGADAGVAFDGDADRLIAVDGDGQVVDGDRLLGLFALDLRDRGRLAGGTVVVTVMTNLGFHQAMAREGIAVHQTQVGDRYVLEALDHHGWSLGGEQSGHLVFRQLATTGDGVLSAVLLLDLVKRRGQPLSDLAAKVMDRLPQVLRNVAVADRARLADAASVWDEVATVEAGLAGNGRVLLRPSGTEPLIRVMVEAPTEAEAAAAASRIEARVTAALG